MTKHKVRVTVSPIGISEITLDGEPIPNVVEATIRVTGRGARVELVMEGVEIEYEGVMTRTKVTHHTEDYEAKP